MLSQPYLMFIVLISPVISLIADYILRKYKIKTIWIVFLILLLIIPSLLLELTGYSFSIRLYSFIATTLLLIGIQLGLFTIVHVRVSVKIVTSIAFTLILGFFVFVGLYAAGYVGGSRAVIQEAKFRNYIALTLELILYSSNKVLRVKKTALAGILQKNIYEQDLPDSVIKEDCDINFSDGSKTLVFDLCENKLSLRD